MVHDQSKDDNDIYMQRERNGIVIHRLRLSEYEYGAGSNLLCETHHRDIDIVHQQRAIALLDTVSFFGRIHLRDLVRQLFMLRARVCSKPHEVNVRSMTQNVGVTRTSTTRVI